MLTIRTPLWLFGLATSAFATVGCGDGEDPGFLVDWVISYVDGDTAVSCQDAGTPDVVFTAVNRRTQESFATNMPPLRCEDRRAIIQPLPRGDYDVNISLFNLDGEVVSSTDGQFPVYSHGLTDLEVIGFKVQSWVLRWVVVRGSRASSCTEAGGQTVRLRTKIGEAPEVNYAFACTDQVGITTAIPTGQYVIIVELLNAAGKVISFTKDPLPFFASATQRAELPTVVFDVP